jgi:hypothetical protein
MYEINMKSEKKTLKYFNMLQAEELFMQLQMN